MDIIKVLIDENEIKKRIKQIANNINDDYKDKKPVVICILKGAVYFFSDLTKNLNIECEFDFIKISSYEGKKSTEKIDIKYDSTKDLKNKDVIIVEDIIDTGYTMLGLYDYLMEKEPNSIKLCVLLDKPERREIHDIKPDYTGFVIPDRFVIGYGLDYDEKFRNLNNVSCITNIHDKEIEKDRENIRKQLVKRKNSLH